MQLGKIIDAGSVLRILGALQLFQNPTLGKHFGNHFGWLRVMVLRKSRKLMHHVSERTQRFRRARGHAFDLFHMFNRFEKSGAMGISIRGNESFRTNAQSALRHIEDTSNVHIVRRIHDGLQIRERILDFPAFVEFGAADELIRQVGIDHGLFERA